MTHSDPFAYFEEALDGSGAALFADAYADVIDEWSDPAFELLDDAEGRFVVDPVSGLICLADEALLENERNTVHAVRLLTREASGDAYEMTLKVKISGLVPALVRSDDPVSAPPVEEVQEEAAAPAPLVPWRDFAAFLALDAACPVPDRTALFGAACAFRLEEGFDLDDAALTLNDPLPAPASDEAWA